MTVVINCVGQTLLPVLPRDISAWSTVGGNCYRCSCMRYILCRCVRALRGPSSNKTAFETVSAGNEQSTVVTAQ